MTESVTHEAVFSSIVESRGGRGALSVEQLAISSAMAHVLVTLGDGDPAGAASVAALAALLPKPRPPETADLGKLSDSEFNTLAGLLAKARGEAFQPLPKRRRSPRVRDGLMFIAALDRIAARIVVGAEPHHETPTEFERDELRSHVNILLVGLNGTAADLLGYPAAAMRERAPQSLPPPIEGEAIELTPLPPNVVPMVPTNSSPVSSFPSHDWTRP
jgi:hypothetical protein